MDLETRIAELEKKVAEFEKALASNVPRIEKDLWDRINQVAPLLIAIVIAAGGWIVTDLMKQIDINNSQRQAAQQEASTRLTARVAQAQLISSFLDPLLSVQPSEQKLAIKALLLALPEDGPDLIQSLAATSAITEVQSFAESALEDRREDLVQGLFVDDDDVRIASMNDLVYGWTRDVRLIPKLLASAGQNLSDQTGMLSVLTVLFSMDNDLLIGNRQAIEQILNSFSGGDEETRKLVDQIRLKMGSP